MPIYRLNVGGKFRDFSDAVRAKRHGWRSGKSFSVRKLESSEDKSKGRLIYRKLSKRKKRSKQRAKV